MWNKLCTKNSDINSFIETQRLTLSYEKSVVIHVGKKCKFCPKLKVHKKQMKSADTVRYLGDIISSSGSIRPCVEDRRSKGWGKLAEIKGILSELPKVRQIEVGLKLRETKIHNGILYNTEAWSNVGLKDLERLEQVDTSALKALVSGHAKCTKVFYYLEFGTLMVRHLVTIRRIMFHHHILTREKSELIQKVYFKQKETKTKGDWLQLIEEDFNFIREQMDEENIKRTPKEEYRKLIKEKVENRDVK